MSRYRFAACGSLRAFLWASGTYDDEFQTFLAVDTVERIARQRSATVSKERVVGRAFVGKTVNRADVASIVRGAVPDND